MSGRQDVASPRKRCHFSFLRCVSLSFYAMFNAAQELISCRDAASCRQSHLLFWIGRGSGAMIGQDACGYPSLSFDWDCSTAWGRPTVAYQFVILPAHAALLAQYLQHVPTGHRTAAKGHGPIQHRRQPWRCIAPPLGHSVASAALTSHGNWYM